MRVVRQGFIPFGGFGAINLFGVLFVRREMRLTPVVMNHEEIHTAQMRELGYLFFYLAYVAEWLVRLVTNRFDAMRAYRAISFEREAYARQEDLRYLERRRRFSMWRFHNN